MEIVANDRWEYRCNIDERAKGQTNESQRLPQALPIFRQFVHSITHTAESPEDLEVVSFQLRGCL
jgi:hypothetical protein